MNDPKNLEIPEAMRQMAEKNVEQARGAYHQFMDMARQAQAMISQSSGTAAENALEVQQKALRYADDNMQAGFDFMAELAKAGDSKEFLEIQSRHAEKSMRTDADQAQELARLMTEAAQKTQQKP